MFDIQSQDAHILVVDDSQEILEFLKQSVLEPEGYQVTVARDGSEGLHLATSQHPNLILLDYEMPRMNGVEVLQALNEQKCHIPVILITSYGSESVAVDVFRLGVRDYVPKPFSIVELLQSIERVLHETRLQQERDALFKKLQETNAQLAQRVKELDTLYRVGKSVTTLKERNKLMERIVDAALFLTGALDGQLALIDPLTGDISTLARREHRGKECTSIDEERNIITQSLNLLLNVPVKIGDRMMGSLTVSSKRNRVPLNQQDKRLLRMLADYAAIAIENFRLVSELEVQRKQEKQELRDRFSHYISSPVIERILKQPKNVFPGGQRQIVTVLFADLRGFTEFSAQSSPEALIAVLNRHMAVATDAILERKGTLDKFIGDEVMAFFNAPTPQDYYALRAVDAAHHTQRTLHIIHQQLPVHQRLQFGIGIATGEAIVGNVGTYDLVNFTVVGPTVVKAHTLQELAPPGKILICHNTYESVKQIVRAKALSPVQIKGQLHPEPVYEVQEIRPYSAPIKEIEYQERQTV